RGRSPKDSTCIISSKRRLLDRALIKPHRIGIYPEYIGSSSARSIRPGISAFGRALRLWRSPRYISACRIVRPIPPLCWPLERLCLCSGVWKCGDAFVYSYLREPEFQSLSAFAAIAFACIPPYPRLHQLLPCQIRRPRLIAWTGLR
ncbi:unnamed protein product, partial [Mycena citricolor]